MSTDANDLLPTALRSEHRDTPLLQEPIPYPLCTISRPPDFTAPMERLTAELHQRASELEMSCKSLEYTPRENGHPLLRFQIGYHNAIIGRLVNENLEAVYQWYAGEAFLLRADARLREDMMLFLVGPFGSAGNPEWEMQKSRIETNEKVCRKLVWLPPDETEDPSSSLEKVLSRSFLAQPWRKWRDAPPSKAPLDHLATLFLKPGASADIDPDVLIRWLPILSGIHDNREDLARALVDAYGRVR